MVNTTAANLDLSKGYVSAAVLKTAGSKLQKECHAKHRNGIGLGEIAVTDGYNAACKNIYHMALQPYSQTSMKSCIEVSLGYMYCTCIVYFLKKWNITKSPSLFRNTGQFSNLNPVVLHGYLAYTRLSLCGIS